MFLKWLSALSSLLVRHWSSGNSSYIWFKEDEMVFEVSLSSESALSEWLWGLKEFLSFLLTVIFDIKGELSVDMAAMISQNWCSLTEAEYCHSHAGL